MCAENFMKPPSWYPTDPHRIWHPYTQMAVAPPPIPIERAEGAHLYTADGRTILDAISSWWVTLHGHCHPRIQHAIATQAGSIDHVIFAGFTHEPGSRLADKLVELTPSGLEHVFYSDNGSTAVEVALKMALQYWVNQGDRNRTLFVTLEGSYHGDTFGAMAVGAVDVFHDVFRPLLFETRRLPNPYCHPVDEIYGRTAEQIAAKQIDSAAHLDQLLADEGDRIAAVIVEPMVQGAGGMILWPTEFLARVRQICDRHHALLIADEVFTGFGRTAKLFACEHSEIAPDILCLSKALTGGVLPLAATLATREIYETFLSDDRSKTFFHGHSFTANPIACAAALESTAILEETGLSRAGEIEAIHSGRLEGIQSHGRVVEARGLGLIARIELSPQSGAGGYLDQLGPHLSRRFLARDILLRPLGNVLYLVPPLAITDAELHRIYDAIEEEIDLLE